MKSISNTYVSDEYADEDYVITGTIRVESSDAALMLHNGLGKEGAGYVIESVENDFHHPDQMKMQRSGLLVRLHPVLQQAGVAELWKLEYLVGMPTYPVDGLNDTLFAAILPADAERGDAGFQLAESAKRRAAVETFLTGRRANVKSLMQVIAASEKALDPHTQSVDEDLMEFEEELDNELEQYLKTLRAARPRGGLFRQVEPFTLNFHFNSVRNLAVEEESLDKGSR